MDKKAQRMAARVSQQGPSTVPPNPWQYSGARFPPFGFQIISCVHGGPIELYTFLPKHAADWAERPRYWLMIPPLPFVKPERESS